MIEQQLSERFHTVLEDEPPLGFDPDQLVDDQRRNGRRHAALVGAVVSAAAAIVAVSVVGLAGGEQRESAPPADGLRDTPPGPPTFEIVTFESRIGGTQEVTPDPTVFEVTGKGSPPIGSERVNIDSFLVDSYPGDRGVLEIRRGDEVLHRVSLGNHDSYAGHLQEPWSFTPEAPLRVAISCHQAGAPGGTCEAGVTFSGVRMTP